MNTDSSVSFFDQQFQRQVRESDLALNPFEQQALPHLQGVVLDYGCGLGNLALAAARRGCNVVALDGSYNAIYAKWLPGETPAKIKPDPAIAPY